MLALWRSALSRLALFFLPWTFIGWLADELYFTLLFACGVLLVWHYRNFHKLADWLWYNRKLTPPQSRGSWGVIFEGIYQLQKANRRRRMELGSMIKRFREGAEAMPDATVVFDIDFSIVWCNRLAQQLLGLKWPRDRGQRLSNLIRSPDFIKHLSEGDFSEPVNIPSPLNKRVILEIRIMPYAEGQMLLMARDVSKIKQLENMRQDFVANVSHELRTPLTVLQGYLEMMEDPQALPPAMMEKARDMMAEQTSRMRALIEQLLTISRLESRAENVLEQVVKVPALLELVATEARRLNEEKQHELIFDIDPELDTYGVEQELRSAFSNLVFNAIHYTPENGQITVRWYQDDDGMTFSVEDNGDGIASEHLARLTERFYRVDKARSRKTGGSGLGLSIVKHVLSRHYSHLKIKSVPSQGSCFYFVLPETLKVGHKHND